MYSRGIARGALLERGHAVGELEERDHDAVHLAGDRAAQLVLVEHAGLDEGLAEPPLAARRA